MAEAAEQAEWDRTSIVWATLANANRDERKHPEPFIPEDIHPLRKKPEVYSGPDWAQINQIRQQYKVTKLNGRQCDQSRRSVSDVEREGCELP